MMAKIMLYQVFIVSNDVVTALRIFFIELFYEWFDIG